MKLTEIEKRILYNFVIGEHNLFLFPNLENLEDENGSFVVAIKKKLCPTNLNNFDGDKKEYAKTLQSLIKKLQ